MRVHVYGLSITWFEAEEVYATFGGAVTEVEPVDGAAVGMFDVILPGYEAGRSSTIVRPSNAASIECACMRT